MVRQKTTTVLKITPHKGTKKLEPQTGDEADVQYKVAACRSHKSVPEIEIKSASKCGPCLFDAVREAWDDVKGDVVVAEGELERLREEREGREWGLRKSFPPQGRRAPSMQYRKLGEKVSGGSRLRFEVRREDIEDEGAVSWNLFTCLKFLLR
jgi:hypothetical protein